MYAAIPKHDVVVMAEAMMQPLPPRNPFGHVPSIPAFDQHDNTSMTLKTNPSWLITANIVLWMIFEALVLILGLISGDSVLALPLPVQVFMIGQSMSLSLVCVPMIAIFMYAHVSTTVTINRELKQLTCYTRRAFFYTTGKNYDFSDLGLTRCEELASMARGPNEVTSVNICVPVLGHTAPRTEVELITLMKLPIVKAMGVPGLWDAMFQKNCDI